MSNRYHQFEQVNGGVVNDALDRIDELEEKLHYRKNENKNMQLAIDAFKQIISRFEDDNAKLRARHDQAMMVLKQIAEKPRKTKEQRLANALVTFLESMN